MKTSFLFITIAVVVAGCGDSTSPSSGTQDELPRTAAAKPKQTVFDIIESSVLRTGPSETSERKVNEKATRLLGETHYLEVNSEVTVEVLQRKEGWAEVRAVQPEYFRDTHRGWIPESALKVGVASNKLSGWIRSPCIVYDEPNTSATVVGQITRGAVTVADDGSGWLRLLEGPIKNNNGSGFLSSPDFNGGLYIEAKAFTTTIPSKW